MSEAFKPGTTDHLVTRVSHPSITTFLLCGYTIATDFIFLEYFTLKAMFTRISLLFSLILVRKTTQIISISRFTKIEYYVGILPRYLYLLELTSLFDSPFCSLFRKPRKEVTMDIEIVFFRLLLKRHTLILILFQLLCLSGINHYTSV